MMEGIGVTSDNIVKIKKKKEKKKERNIAKFIWQTPQYNPLANSYGKLHHHSVSSTGHCNSES
jgi:hypothetical protein